MQKEIIKQALAAAEKEQQEKEIGRIKKIIQSHLEQIETKTEKRRKLDEEIGLIKKDLDDLKAGRLDRICERHEKDERAREVRIIYVERIEKQYVPYYPWRSPWIVYWSNGTQPYQSAVNFTTYTTGTTDNVITTTGTQFSNFASGSYQIGNHIVNL